MPEAVRDCATVANERFDEFFSRMLEAQARAASFANGASSRRRYRIAGHDIELNLAHHGLAELLCNAMAHLEIAVQDEPDFTFHIWDEASSGIAPPPACWSQTELLGHGEIAALTGADCYLKVAAGKSIIAARRLSRRAAVWLRSPGDVEEWERAAPLLALINWWASGFGYFNVPLPVSIPISSMSLMTTVSLGRPTGPRLQVYSTAKLFNSDLCRFPLLKQREKEAFHTRENKAVFYLNDIVPHRLSSGFPIRAVLLPHPSGRRDTQIMRGSPSAALLYLGPNTNGRLLAASLSADLLPC
jgi:hypothetical protein